MAPAATMDSDSSIDQLFGDDIAPRELPTCEVEHLDAILLLFKTSHPTVRSKVLTDLSDKDGAYIVKLLDLFDVCELDADTLVLHKLFDIFYAILEMCSRDLIEVLLDEKNFLSVVGVFGYNPGLKRETDFRLALEGEGGFNEVIPITDRSVVDRVHTNFRIQVIKDNVLSRFLPDGCMLLLDHMANENNYYILTYISDTEDYVFRLQRMDVFWHAGHTDEAVRLIFICSKELIASDDKRQDGLGLLKTIINLTRVTKRLDRPQRRETFGALPVFSSIIDTLFGDGKLFAAFGAILGAPDSKAEEVASAVDMLNVLVSYLGPDRLRTYLASEGKCVLAPTSDDERITWTPESSLFTALLVVFERNELLRIQQFSLLREIFRVPQGQDDKFLSVLYPNYMRWLLQPLKSNAFAENESAMFNLHDSIMELLTFCTENHGYRVKYLFGQQPVASYAEKDLRSTNKLFVIHAVKFVRACAERSEAFFSRFLIQNDLFTPMLANLEIGKANMGVVSSAILEVLSFIEKANLMSLVEHIYTKFYETYKAECPLVFDAIRVRYDRNSGSTDAAPDCTGTNTIRFVRAGSIGDTEELYWEKDTETTGPTLELKSGLSEEEVSCQNRPRPIKLVDYDDDDNGTTSVKKEILAAGVTAPSPSDADIDDERELLLPVRMKEEDDVDAQSFLGRSNVLAHKKAHQKAFGKARSPQLKNVFQKISWKLTSPTASSENECSLLTNATTESDNNNDDNRDAECDTRGIIAGSNFAVCGDGASGKSSSALKRKLLVLEEAANSESMLKKAKACTPISSS